MSIDLETPGVFDVIIHMADMQMIAPRCYILAQNRIYLSTEEKARLYSEMYADAPNIASYEKYRHAEVIIDGVEVISFDRGES